MAPRFDVDKLIDRILSVGTKNNSLTGTVSEIELAALCAAAKDVFMKQPPMVEVEPPVRICGDIHGQYADLLRLFDRCGFPPTSNYLFLGDYVDRGKQNLETISLLLCYKVKFPENVFLLRGNHECAAINRVYGFYAEVNRRYSSRLWQVYQEVFNSMPFVGLVGGKILCMHGGWSKDIQSLDQLRNVKRPIDPPNPSMLLDLLWADPDKWTRGYTKNTRGASCVFGPDVVIDMCNKHDIDLIARAHQVVEDGYEFFAGRRLVTIFSAPHYCGEFDNAAAVMTVDEKLKCGFDVLRPVSKK